jgi:hypothetical protein
MGFFTFLREKRAQSPAGRPVRPAGARPRLEELESRLAPASVSGNAWPNPQLVTLSFVPDGTVLGQNSAGFITSNLFSTFNAKFGSAATWENVILKAAQTWAAQTNLNFAVIADNGGDLGSGPDQQGDPNMGDIRIGGDDFGTSALAQAYMPPPADNYSIAGDIQFNTGQNFNLNGAAYDLYTVALHEIGHALGLAHSTLQGAVMYGTYNGAKKTLATDDIGGIRSIYSNGNPRTPDQYHQNGASNGSFATATDLTSQVSPSSLTASVTGLDMTHATDQEYYTFTAPSGSTGTLQVAAQSQGLSLLAPKLTVYAADQTTVLGSASGAGQYGTTLTVTVNNVTAGQQFYVKVTGADTSVFATGAYALNLTFGNNPLPVAPSPNTTTAAGVVPTAGGGVAVKYVPDTPVSTYTAGPAATNALSPKAVAMDANGNYVLTWSAYGEDGGAWGVFGRRYAADGSPRGSEFQVNTTVLGNQEYSTVAMDPAGDFVITWSSIGGDPGIRAQRYAADGTPRGGEIRVNTFGAGSPMYSSAAMDAAGDFVITWSSLNQDGSGWGVYAQRYGADGTPWGGEFQVNTTTWGNQMYSSAAMDAVGDFVVTWSSNDVGRYQVFAQRYDSSGNAQGGEFQVSGATRGDQMYSSAARDAAGDFVITWSSDASGTGRIYAQRYDATGAKQGNTFKVNSYPGPTKWSGVAMDSQGNILVTWCSQGQNGLGWGIFAQQYDKTGATIGLEFQANATTIGDHLYPSAALDTNGDTVIVWSGSGPGNPAGVFAQHNGGANRDALEADGATSDPAAATAPGLLPDGSQGTANQRYVGQLYRSLLGRQVDVMGLAYWSSFLDAGASPDQVARGILAGGEAQAAQVQALFQQYLHRAADPLGLAYFGGLLRAGGTREQVAALITGSDEYLANAGCSTDAWLGALYHDVLGRAADGLGQSFAGQLLAAGDSRAQVAASLLGSDEYRQDLLQQDCQHYLGRPLDDAGRAAWLGALRQGASDDAVLALILGGPGQEFFNRTAP